MFILGSCYWFLFSLVAQTNSQSQLKPMMKVILKGRPNLNLKSVKNDQWYFVFKTVLTYCEKKLFRWFFRSLEKIIRTVKRQYNILNPTAFLTCSWRFFRSNPCNNYIPKLERNTWDLETYRKVRKLVNLVAQNTNP